MLTNNHNLPDAIQPYVLVAVSASDDQILGFVSITGPGVSDTGERSAVVKINAERVAMQAQQLQFVVQGTIYRLVGSCFVNRAHRLSPGRNGGP